MNSKKKIIVCLVIILAIVVCLIIYKFLNNDEEYILEGEPETDIEYRNTYSRNIQKISDISEYNTIRSCISEFYTYYALLYDEDVIGTDSDYGLDYYKEVTYGFLSKNYVQRNEITVDNIDSKFEEIEDSKVEIYTVYYLTEYDTDNGVSSDVQAYFVKGLIRNRIDSSDCREFSIIVYLDTNNMTFELDLDNTLGIDFDELYDAQEVDFELPESVSKRKMNDFNYLSTSYEDIATMIFNNTVKLMVYNTDKVYELLTDSAKNTYKSESELATYVENNKRKLQLLTFKIYEIDYEDEVFLFKVYDKNTSYEFKFYFENGFSNYKYSFVEL